jgi:hypothetical protein
VAVGHSAAFHLVTRAIAAFYRRGQSWQKVSQGADYSSRELDPNFSWVRGFAHAEEM